MKLAFFSVFGLFLFLVSCQSDSDKKIRLSSGDTSSIQDTQTASSVLQILAEDQRSIAIVLFRNETGDPAMDWLERGLMEMLTTDMKQSPLLNVISANRFLEIAQQQGKDDKALQNQTEIDQIAEQAKIQIVLSGRYYFQREHLFIDVEMRDVNNRQNMYVRSVEGESLEKIFAMVDELSSRVRENLRVNFGKGAGSEIDLAEMTSSVEAFRCFSEAQEKRDKLFIAEAERCYKDAIKYDTTFAAAYLELAMMKMDSRGNSDHKKLLEKADIYKYKLSEPDQLRLQILQKFNQRDIPGALGLLEDAVEKFPLDLNFRVQLAGYYLEYLHDLDRALQEYEYVMELDPNRKLIYNQLGYLYAARGDFTTALKYFDQYQLLAPDEPNPYDSKAEILIRAGRFDDAESLLLTAFKKWPNFYYLPYRLLTIYFELGNEDKSITYINVLNDLPSEQKFHFDIEESLAEIYWRFGKLDKAIKTYRKVMINDPSSTTVPLALARLYRSEGDSDAAMQIYQETLSRMRHQLPDLINEPTRFGDMIGSMLETDLPLFQSIQMLESLKVDPQSEIAVLRDIGLCILYIRIQDIEKAKNIFENKREEFSTFILESSFPRWQYWRYVYEIMDAISTEPEFGDAYQNLLVEAEKSPRRNIETLIKLGIARYASVSESKELTQNIYRKFGLPADTVWRVIGPFAVENRSGFNYNFPPENKIDMNVTYSSAGKNISWQVMNDGFQDGYSNLKELYHDYAWSVAYALVYIYSPEEKKAQIRLGTDEACKLWLNNKKIWQHYIREGATIDRDQVTVLLHPGYNKLLLKVTNSSMDWGYYLRITDEHGQGFPDISFHSYDQVEKTFAVR